MKKVRWFWDSAKLQHCIDVFLLKFQVLITCYVDNDNDDHDDDPNNIVEADAEDDRDVYFFEIRKTETLAFTVRVQV